MLAPGQKKKKDYAASSKYVILSKVNALYVLIARRIGYQR